MACTGKLEYLSAILICLMDTGMWDADRRKLRWKDVDFNGDLIRGSGGPVKMTPRLCTAMLALWHDSDKNLESFVWGGGNLTGFKRDLGLARRVAQVEGLHVNHFRPTAAWRMAQAGREFLQIADVLGCRDTKYLKQYLETDPGTAEQERNSPSFRQFISGQFGASDDSNGDVQKNEAPKKRGPQKGFNARITEDNVRAALRTLGQYAPQEKLAEVIGVDARSLREWHKARGLSYKELRQQFTETGGN